MENNNALQVFSYEGQQVRTVEKDGESWFVANDVAQALGYINSRDAIQKHVFKEDITMSRIATPSRGIQEMTIINKPGVYALIFGSKLESARKFKYWLAHEVLPQIENTGAYIPDEALKNSEFVKGLAERITAIQEANDELREQIARDQAATTFGKVMLGLADGNKGMDFHKAAQLLAQQGFPIGRNRLYKKARDKKWLCQQKKIRNQPTQGALQSGLVGWQSEYIDGQCALVVALTVKGFSQLLDELTKEYRPIIYLIDREEAKDKALANKKARALKV